MVTMGVRMKSILLGLLLLTSSVVGEEYDHTTAKYEICIYGSTGRDCYYIRDFDFLGQGMVKTIYADGTIMYFSGTYLIRER